MVQQKGGNGVGRVSGCNKRGRCGRGILERERGILKGFKKRLVAKLLSSEGLMRFYEVASKLLLMCL